MPNAPTETGTPPDRDAPPEIDKSQRQVGPGYWWELYKGHFRLFMSRYMAYRVELVLWLISMILQPVVFLVVWRAAAGHMGGAVSGYTQGEIAAYFIIVMLVNHLTMAWVMFEWDGRVRRGELSYLLVRPHHPIHRDVAENITFKSATFPVMLVTALALIAFFNPEFSTRPWGVVALVPALLMAYALRFTSDWTAAMGAFYTEKVEAVNAVYFFILLLFSGQMAPLSFLPEIVRNVAAVLPFRWMIDFPARLLMGKVSPAEMQIGFAAQAGWLLVLTLLRRSVWSRGLRRYTAVGI